MAIPAIDTHAHLWTEEYLDALKAGGLEGTDIARGMGALDTPNEMQQRLRMMDAAQVSHQILSATPQSPYLKDERAAVRAAQMINNRYAEIVNEYPRRFEAYGALPFPHVDQSIQEAERVIRELRFKGVGINTLIAPGLYPFDEPFYPIWECLNALNTIVYIHPTGFGACSSMVNDKELEWVVGAPIEDMVALLHLLKSDIPYRYRNITFHMAHLGGGIGFQLQRLEDNFEDWDAFPQSPSQTLREHFYFDAANFLDEALVLSVKLFGADKIMMGSDFPYFKDAKYTRAVDYIRRADLSEGDKEQILRKNAEALYHCWDAQESDGD